MKNNYDPYHQRELNINKGVQHDNARSQMDLHYQSLYQSLVHSEFDSEVFNDTFIRITSDYDGEQDFKELFIKLFRRLKGEYYRNEKAMRCSSVPMDDNFDMSGNDNAEDEEPTDNTQDDTIKKLMEYADDIQTKKTKWLKRKAKRATNGLPNDKMEEFKKVLPHGAPFMRDMFE